MKAFTKFQGTIVPIMNDNIDTDQLIPKQYLKSTEKTGFGKYLFDEWRYNEDGSDNLNFNLNKAEYKKGTILITGENFGCGSSRAHAPGVIKAKGVPVIIAQSFARIFFRNAINIGLPVVEIGEQVDRIDAGDAIGVDLSKGIVYNLTKNEQYQGTELPQFIQDIAAAGGLVNFAKHRK